MRIVSAVSLGRAVCVGAFALACSITSGCATSSAGADQTPAAPAPAATPAPPPAPAPAPDQASASPSPVVLDSETLRLEGTPEVPAALRADLNRYLETRSAGLADVSEDGRQILVTTRFGQTSQVHLVKAPMAARTQLTFAAEPASSPRFVPGDPNAIVYIADIGGDEQYQIWRLDLRTGRRVRLTDAESRNGGALWSRDGSLMAYSSNSRNKRDFDIWVSDGRDPASAERIVDAKGWWYPLDWSRDGNKLLIGEYISANESRLYVVDVASRALTRISPEGKATYANARFAADGQRVYVVSDRDGEFGSLYESDITGSSWRPLTADIPWNVEGMDVSPDGRTLAFTINQDGYSVLHLLDTRRRQHRVVDALPKGLIGGLQFVGKGSDTLGFTLSSATRSGDAYTYQVRRKTLTRWTESELGGLRSDELVEPELIRYETFDGRSISAFYYAPEGAGPFPVIINIHGGPEGQARPYFSSLTQYVVNERKIAVLYPNVRGSSGYGKSFIALDNGKKREDSVKDIGALLDWIATQPELDQRRVGVLGGSYGGYMVLASLVHFGERIAAGVDIVGISNFVTFLENTADYRRDLRRVEYGDERDPEMRAHLEAISPANHADRIESALFVAQGANDPRVPASEAEQILAAVRAAGHDVWYMLAKNEGHGFRKKENRDLYYLLTVMFFDKHLKAGD